MKLTGIDVTQLPVLFHVVSSAEKANEITIIQCRNVAGYGCM